MRRSLGIAVVGLIAAAWAASASAQVTAAPAPGGGAQVMVGQPVYRPVPGVTRYYSSGYQGMTATPVAAPTTTAAPTTMPTYPQTYYRPTTMVRQRVRFNPFRRWRMRRGNRWYAY